MSAYPTSPRSDFLEWCESHQSGFVDAYGEIGLTKEQALAFAATTEKAHTLLIDQAEALQRYEVATREVEAIMRLLRTQAGDACRSIRAFAELQAAPAKVYATARVAPPATPSPMSPPGRPTRLSATLTAATGALTLTWKAAHPAGVGGTTYVIRRKLPGESAFTLLGTAGKKQFVDETLPAGIENVQYSVQSQRGQKTSALSATLLVNIGKSAAGPDARVPLLSSSVATSERSDARGTAAKSQNIKTSRSQKAALGLA
ncbi:MAG: hypothetical protein H6818_07570 [Phycisphaerales bacterium]|nr:hypothetical protein [Phycisphaerales bacterium]